MNNIRIKSVTNVRGFIRDLFQEDYNNLKFEYDENRAYETNSKGKVIISNLIKAPIFDLLGIFQVVKTDDTDNVDAFFSYNRFLSSTKPYVIYLENPLAPVHYCINRPNSLFSREKLKKVFADKNLKTIVCLSKACKNTISNFYDIDDHVNVEQIYPLVRTRKKIDESIIKKKSQNKRLKCLYISSEFELKGGEDILKAFGKLDESKFELLIITKRETVREEDLFKINKLANVTIREFNLSKDELADVYLESNVLLNPTRQDSFSLVVLEAMKYGNMVLSSDLYAIPEMVIDNKTGFLVNNIRYRFFNENKMPNPSVWNHRKKTIYSSFIDDNVVSFLIDKLNYVEHNREELTRLCLNSFKQSNSGEFNCDYIKNKWEDVYINAVGKC
ncbi:glycosyltransferase family 4 protein [Stecheria intestinalis]|nr:glycosyltransferase family 4 protein [Stecheria intestinalis]